jgi:tetratricopeptide (TPR) repeat protein
MNFSVGRFEKSAEYFAHLLAINPYCIDHWVMFANCQKNMKRFDLAIKAIDRAIDIFENEPILYHKKANLLELAGDFEGAENCKKMLIKLKPEFYAWLGDMHNVQNNDSNSLPNSNYQHFDFRNRESAEKEVTYNLNDIKQILKKGEYALSSGRFQEALKIGLRASRLFNDIHAIELVCASLIALERYEDAIRQLNSFCKNSNLNLNSNPGLVLFSAIAYFGLGDERKALDYLDIFLSSKNATARHYRIAAEFLILVGEREKAKVCFQMLAKNPATSQDLYISGLGFHRLEEYEKAAECFAKFLEINPKFENMLFREDFFLNEKERNLIKQNLKKENKGQIENQNKKSIDKL